MPLTGPNAGPGRESTDFRMWHLTEFAILAPSRLQLLLFPTKPHLYLHTKCYPAGDMIFLRLLRCRFTPRPIRGAAI